MEGSEALPFVHILQDEELVQQSVVCCCRKEGLFRIICRINAVGALVFPEVEQATCMRAVFVSWKEEIQDIALKNDQGIVEFSSLLQTGSFN